jgi:hypothetical protein
MRSSHGLSIGQRVHPLTYRLRCINFNLEVMPEEAMTNSQKGANMRALSVSQTARILLSD